MLPFSRWRGPWLRLWREAVGHSQDLLWRQTVWEGALAAALHCHCLLISHIPIKGWDFEYLIFSKLTEFDCWSSSRQRRVLAGSPTPTPPRRSCASLREKDRMQILESLQMRSTTTPVQVCNSLLLKSQRRQMRIKSASFKSNIHIIDGLQTVFEVCLQISEKVIL